MAMFTALPAELRSRIIHLAVETNTDTATAGSLVCREFAQQCFYPLHSGLVLEGVDLADKETTTVGRFDPSVTFAELHNNLQNFPLLRNAVHTLTLRGPQPALRMKAVVSGVDVANPTLSCCNVLNFLSSLPYVDTLIIEHIIWNGCGRSDDTHCTDFLVHRHFCKVTIHSCHSAVRLSHPFDVLGFASSVSRLELGYIDGWSPYVHALAVTQIGSVTLDSAHLANDHAF